MSWPPRCSVARLMRPQRGFTLMELMIAVAIVGILASVAVVAFSKNVKKAKSAEVGEVFAELLAKEELYKSEFNRYLSTGADDTVMFPVVGTTGEPVKKSTGSKPASWSSIGFNPKESLYCGYVAIAGDSSAAPTGTFGPNLIPATGNERQKPWLYVLAECNWNSNVAANSTYGMGVNQKVLVTQNEGK